MSDATILLRDIAGDAATKAASKVNPSDDQLSQIDQAAEDNTWHEAPDMAGMKEKLQIRKKEAKDVGGQASGDAAEAANPDGSRDPTAAADRAAQEQQDGTATGVDTKKGAKEGGKNLKSNLSSRMDDDQKEKMRKYRERTQNYFKDKVPKTRRDQIIFRLKKMIVEVQTHQDCKSSSGMIELKLVLIDSVDQQAIDTLLRLAEEYAGHGKNMAQQGQGSVKGARNQDSLGVAEADLRVCSSRYFLT